MTKKPTVPTLAQLYRSFDEDRKQLRLGFLGFRTPPPKPKRRRKQRR